MKTTIIYKVVGMHYSEDPWDYREDVVFEEYYINEKDADDRLEKLKSGVNQHADYYIIEEIELRGEL